MKHLKKILIVIATLALLVTSLAVVIGAADETEAGSVDTLADYVESVDYEVLVNGITTDVAKQSTKLVDVYKYIASCTWTGLETGTYDKYKLDEDGNVFYDKYLLDENGDPVLDENDKPTYDKVNGKTQKEKVAVTYAELVAMADKYTVEIGNRLHDKIAGATTTALKIEAVNAVKKHLDNCDADEATEGLADLKDKIDITNATVLKDTFATYKPDTPAESMGMVETVYKQLAVYPVDSVKESEFLKALAVAACDVAKAKLDEYKTIKENWEKVKVNPPKEENSQAYVDSDYIKYYSDVTTGILHIQRFLQAVDIDMFHSENEDADAVLADFIAQFNYREELVESKKKELDAKASFDSYDLPVVSNKTYDGDLTPQQLGALDPDTLKAYNAANELYKAENQGGDHKTIQEFEQFTITNSKKNGYQSFKYYTKAASADAVPHLYWYYVTQNILDGFVFDWDMRVNGEARSISLQCVDNTLGTGKSAFEKVLTWYSNGGALAINNNNSDKSNYPDCVVANEVVRVDAKQTLELDVWQHYTITFDYETRRGALYIDYQYIMDVDYINERYTIGNLRFGPSREMNWSWDMDNVKFFRGNSYRITDKFSSMSDAQRFNYFVEYAATDGNPYLSRNLAYKKANNLLPIIEKKTECKTYIDMMTNVDSENYIDYTSQIKIPAMSDNLDLLKGLVDELKAIEITSETLDDVEAMIKEINTFVSENAELINKGDTSEGGYQETIAEVYAVDASLVRIENIIKFVEAIEKFDRANTYLALSRHYAIAKQVFEAAGYGFDEDGNPNQNILDIANDPVVLNFEKTYNNGALTEEDEGYKKPGDEGYVTIFEYYTTFADRVDGRLEYENSKRIVNSINYILGVEGYDHTVAFWEANEDALSGYVALIREIVAADLYDKDYAGVAAAVEVYWELEEYFYKALQKTHIEKIAELLNRYTQTESYIEKSAIVSSAKAYFANNDIALDNVVMPKNVANAVAEEMAQLTDLKVVLGVYVFELYGEKGDSDAGIEDIPGYDSTFGDVLVQQTNYFINIINHMNSVTSFTELEALFNDASAYYYGINVDIEGAREAAEAYDTYRDVLAAIRINNTAFLLEAKSFASIGRLYGPERRDAIFAAVKACEEYLGVIVIESRSVGINMIDIENADVKAALQTYAQLRAEYENTVAAVNAAMVESGAFTAAVRSKQIPVAVLSVIGGITNN